MITTKEKIVIMQAFLDGKSVQVKASDGKWYIVINPLWNWEVNEYRIKPEPIEIYVNIYPDSIGAACKDKQDCLSILQSHGKAIKFIEVLDD